MPSIYILSVYDAVSGEEISNTLVRTNNSVNLIEATIEALHNTPTVKNIGDPASIATLLAENINSPVDIASSSLYAILKPSQHPSNW